MYQSQGWASRLNVAMSPSPMFDPAWGRAVKMHLRRFREYAKAVCAATDAYVSSLGPADLGRTVDTGFVGEQTVAYILGNTAPGTSPSTTGRSPPSRGCRD